MMILVAIYAAGHGSRGQRDEFLLPVQRTDLMLKAAGHGQKAAAAT